MYGALAIKAVSPPGHESPNARSSVFTGYGGPGEGVSMRVKLQALVYDILPPAIVVFSYAVGSSSFC